MDANKQAAFPSAFAHCTKGKYNDGSAVGMHWVGKEANAAEFVSKSNVDSVAEFIDVKRTDWEEEYDDIYNDMLTKKSGLQQQ
jgi:hypothetical protein